MDKGHLSDAQVVKSSREFVCIRLATYEDSEEAEFLQSVFSQTRDLENTVFAFLAPDGKKKLSRAARSPDQVFRSAKKMAAAMKEMTEAYPGQPSAKGVASGKAKPQRLPQMKDFRLALNVASCDGLPLLFGFSTDVKERLALESVLTELAFADRLAGRLQFFVSGDRAELGGIEGFSGKPGYYFVSPNQFGNGASSGEFFPVEEGADELTKVLVGYIGMLDKVEKDHRSHVQQGLREGIDWKSEVPVTDRMSLQASERADRRRRKK